MHDYVDKLPQKRIVEKKENRLDRLGIETLEMFLTVFICLFFSYRLWFTEV